MQSPILPVFGLDIEVASGHELEWVCERILPVIDKKTIEQMAHLSRLEISEKQAQDLSQELTKIMNYFEKISAIKTEGVEPLVTPSENESYWREDVVKNEFTSEEIVANAPDKVGSLFKVPPVV